MMPLPPASLGMRMPQDTLRPAKKNSDSGSSCLTLRPDSASGVARLSPRHMFESLVMRQHRVHCLRQTHANHAAYDLALRGVQRHPHVPALWHEVILCAAGRPKRLNEVAGKLACRSQAGTAGLWCALLAGYDDHTKRLKAWALHEAVAGFERIGCARALHRFLADGTVAMQAPLAQAILATYVALRPSVPSPWVVDMLQLVLEQDVYDDAMAEGFRAAVTAFDDPDLAVALRTLLRPFGGPQGGLGSAIDWCAARGYVRRMGVRKPR